MQDPGLNHMDELFRRAGENYPLKTDDSGWDAVAPHLTAAPVATPVKKGWGSKKLTGWSVLVLLTLATGVVLVKNNRRGNSKPATATSTVQQPKEPLNSTTGKKIIVNRNKKPSTLSYEKNNPVSKETKQQKPISKHNRLTVFNAPEKNKSFPPGKRIKENIRVQSPETNADSNSENNSLPATREDIGTAELTDETLKEEKDGKEEKAEIAEPPQPEKAKPFQIKKGFYWGFAAGPQLNEVKRQGAKKTGFDIGLLAGFRFNNQLSLESGLYFSRKFYFSDGKYFDMTKTGNSMPAGMELVSLKGNSSVFEIPVKLKYDVFTNGKSGWYTVAGLSSYLLARENNDYYAMFNGSPGTMHSSYKKNSNYFAAAISIGIGYEYKISQQSAIRAEPYLQIPLRGIGVGSMPVTSAGIHIGITRTKK